MAHFTLEEVASATIIPSPFLTDIAMTEERFNLLNDNFILDSFDIEAPCVLIMTNDGNALFLNVKEDHIQPTVALKLTSWLGTLVAHLGSAKDTIINRPEYTPVEFYWKPNARPGVERIVLRAIWEPEVNSHYVYPFCKEVKNVEHLVPDDQVQPADDAGRYFALNIHDGKLELLTGEMLKDVAKDADPNIVFIASEFFVRRWLSVLEQYPSADSYFGLKEETGELVFVGIYDSMEDAANHLAKQQMGFGVHNKYTCLIDHHTALGWKDLL